jgi:MOSC domain-containing protein YiiM
MAGTLERIWIKRAKRGPMDPQVRATMVAGRGIAGNANQGGARQVTIIASEMWDTVSRDGLDPAARRANLMVSGIDLVESRGKTLRIGAVRVRLNGETRPCEQMEDAQAGLRAAMQTPWGGGAFGEVLDDGEIAIGDAVSIEASPAAPAR